MMTQAILYAAADQIAEVTSQLNAGLITIHEFLDFMARQRDAISGLKIEGMICPFTGLRYPTAEELAAIDAENAPLDAMTSKAA
jgi:hypothetical protein